MNSLFRVPSKFWWRHVATDTTTTPEGRATGNEAVSEKEEPSTVTDTEKALEEAATKLSKQVEELQVFTVFVLLHTIITVKFILVT